MSEHKTSQLRVEQNVNLKPLNTFGLEAIAKYYVRPRSLDQLQKAYEFAKEHGLACLVLGGGSNILFKQDHYPGLVIHLDIQGIHVEETNDQFYVVVGASENWHELTQFCVNKGIIGLENLSLIPGSVGACPVQNIGAYGVEVAEFISTVLCYDPTEDQVAELTAEQCAFGYRDSVFKRDKAHWVILEVRFVFSKGRKLSLEYGDIADRVDARIQDDPSLALSPRLISEVICEIRSEKLPDPNITGNAGSFFKNPIVDASVFEVLKAKYPQLVAHPYGSQYKLAAGWLIDFLGFKGKVIGGAGVHKLQALVLVNNSGHATSKELFDLVGMIRQEVKSNFGIDLEIEPRVI